MLKVVLTIKLNNEIIKGNLAFSYAKKTGVSIFTKTNATNPNENIFNAIEVSFVAKLLNSPRSNKTCTIMSGIK